MPKRRHESRWTALAELQALPLHEKLRRMVALWDGIAAIFRHAIAAVITD